MTARRETPTEETRCRKSIFSCAGQDYALTEFVARVTEALTVADERVREKYGFGCGRAVALSAELRARAAALTGDARVLVEGFER